MNHQDVPQDLKRPRQKQPTPIVDRLPPHSPEAEVFLLSCMMQNPNLVIGEVVVLLQGGPESFYDLRHRTIYVAMVAMYDARTPIELVLLQQRLKDQQLLDQVGGIQYLITIEGASPAASNFMYYLDIVREKYQLRQGIAVCTALVSRIYDHEGDVEVLLDQAEQDILSIRQNHNTNAVEPIRETVKRAINTVEDWHNRKGGLIGLSTGFADFDAMTGGLIDGDMIVVAGRPSMGKTSLGMNIAEYVALDLRQPVGVFSLEMTRDALVMRILGSRARVNMRNAGAGFLAERDFPKLTGAAGKVASAQVYIDDTGGLSIMQLRARARRLHQQYAIRLFVVDYLQLLHATIGTKRIEHRQQEVAEISGGLKNLAKELKVPVVVLSQMSRDFDRQRGRRPLLSDLRESGAIEQDADIVGMLYAPPGDEYEEERQDAVPVNLNIAKSRNGPCGDIHLTFLKTFTRFESAARVTDQDLPSEQQRFDRRPYAD